MKNMTIEISSVPDREKLVAEIWYKNQMIAEVNQESEDLELEIYCTEKSIRIDYNIFFNALVEAKKKLKS